MRNLITLLISDHVVQHHGRIKDMRKFFLSLLLTFFTLYTFPSFSGILSLDKKMVSVYFNDGDTFKILEGPHKGSRVRIQGINTLESYGPVHSWVNTESKYLMTIANEATRLAQEGQWSCTLGKEKDTYGRLLAQCHDFAIVLLKAGLGHAYSIDNTPALEEYLKAQAKAQKSNLGMWKYGVPDYIITSLHSSDKNKKNTYNRLISTKNGHSKKWFHETQYKICQWVCLDESCMLHVPYEQWYGNERAECLLN
jgi:endonuclease YncB( thermonuclease family)